MQFKDFKTGDCVRVVHAELDKFDPEKDYMILGEEGDRFLVKDEYCTVHLLSENMLFKLGKGD